MQRRRPVADQGRPPHACQWPAWQPPVTTLTGCGAPWRTRTAGSPSWTAPTSRAALTGRRAGNLDQLPFNTAQDEFPGGYLAAAASTTGVVGDVRRCQVRHRTTRTSGCWAGTRRPRKASSPAASPTSRPACASPGASSGRAPTSSSRQARHARMARHRRLLQHRRILPVLPHLAHQAHRQRGEGRPPRRRSRNVPAALYRNSCQRRRGPRPVPPSRQGGSRPAAAELARIEAKIENCTITPATRSPV